MDKNISILYMDIWIRKGLLYMDMDTRKGFPDIWLEKGFQVKYVRLNTLHFYLLPSEILKYNSKQIFRRLLSPIKDKEEKRVL